MNLTRLSQSRFCHSSVVPIVRTLGRMGFDGAQAPHHTPTPHHLQHLAGAGEHFRAWQLASVLALTAGCASTTDVREGTMPTPSRNGLSDLEWRHEEPQSADQETNEATAFYEIAFSLEDEVDNAQRIDELRAPSNERSKTRSLDNERPSELVNEPQAQGARRWNNSEKTIYEYNIYEGSTCAGGTHMGFSAPICP